jgi:RpiB/LacA/LacB family sugar-phosphate isomerase
MSSVVIGSDHAGLSMKEEIVRFLKEEKWEVVDVGTYDGEAVDYPDVVRSLGMSLLDGRAKKGILICGSGVGASVAANKIRGIRAGLCHDTYSAHQGVEHDDMNVLCLGARVIGPEVAKELAVAFLRAEFSGEERHVRRLNKVREIEAAAGTG